MTSEQDKQLEKGRVIAEAALEKSGLDLVALDVREISSFADTFVLVTGTSDRHVRAIADAIQEAAAKMGGRTLGVEGYNDGQWILVDLDDVIAHVFLHDVRSHYDLERLWSDAPVLEFGTRELRSQTQ